jgi:hypothetical protein
MQTGDHDHQAVSGDPVGVSWLSPDSEVICSPACTRPDPLHLTVQGRLPDQRRYVGRQAAGCSLERTSS